MQPYHPDGTTNTELSIELNSQLLRHYQQRAHYQRSMVFHQVLLRLKKLFF